MKRIVSILAAILLAILAVVPMVSASADGVNLYVSSSNGKGVNMRAGASKDDTVIYKLGEATKVTVLGYVDSDWAYVQAEGRSKTGYVMRKFLSSTDPTTLKQTFKSVTPYEVTVNPTRSGGYVNLRASASKKAASLEQMYKGTVLTVTAESRAFYRVYDENGTVGYVVKAYVK